MTIYVVMRHQYGQPDVPVIAADSMSVATMHAITLDNAATATGSDATHTVELVELDTAGDKRGH